MHQVAGWDTVRDVAQSGGQRATSIMEWLGLWYRMALMIFRSPLHDPRSTAATAMNAVSSRSHAVVQLELMQEEVVAFISGKPKVVVREVCSLLAPQAAPTPDTTAPQRGPGWHMRPFSSMLTSKMGLACKHVSVPIG